MAFQSFDFQKILTDIFEQNEKVKEQLDRIEKDSRARNLKDAEQLDRIENTLATLNKRLLKPTSPQSPGSGSSGPKKVAKKRKL